MKKLIAIIVLSAGILTGCNRQILDFNYSFTKAYLIDTGETIEIVTWDDYDSSDMIQFTSTDGITYLTHSSNVILMSR